MKTADSSLITHLQTELDLKYVELYTITLTSGDVLRYCSHDGDYVVGANTFIGSGLIIPSRGPTRVLIGVEVDETEITFDIGMEDDGSSPTVLRDMTMQQLAAFGWMDKAEVLIQRLFVTDYGVVPSWGAVYKFGGVVAKPSEISRARVVLEVQSHVQQLQNPVPLTIIEPSCRLVLFDSLCTLNRATFAVTSTVHSGSTGIVLYGPTGHADDYFALGFLEFTAGANQGVIAPVKAYTGSSGAIELWAPLPYAPTVGDAFTIYPGCDKTKSTCNSKFSNLIHFAGYPFIPAPETAI